ncbi:unnamed protein product [Rangifer tarandus platyrhynchus]|uniref:Uncharacterized protein n=1 Tax=Rangifer tarandus platyrhynchus TaxID=3082113 RepID=A0ABN8XLQ6_RANTA|nr:unnamed protein product [Rangifer tarandus platyrhynchus]
MYAFAGYEFIIHRSTSSRQSPETPIADDYWSTGPHLYGLWGPSDAAAEREQRKQEEQQQQQRRQMEEQQQELRRRMKQQQQQQQQKLGEQQQPWMEQRPVPETQRPMEQNRHSMQKRTQQQQPQPLAQQQPQPLAQQQPQPLAQPQPQPRPHQLRQKQQQQPQHEIQQEPRQQQVQPTPLQHQTQQQQQPPQPAHQQPRVDRTARSSSGDCSEAAAQQKQQQPQHKIQQEPRQQQVQPTPLQHQTQQQQQPAQPAHQQPRVDRTARSSSGDCSEAAAQQRHKRGGPLSASGWSTSESGEVKVSAEPEGPTSSRSLPHLCSTTALPRAGEPTAVDATTDRGTAAERTQGDADAQSDDASMRTRERATSSRPGEDRAPIQASYGADGSQGGSSADERQGCSSSAPHTQAEDARVSAAPDGDHTTGGRVFAGVSTAVGGVEAEDARFDAELQFVRLNPPRLKTRRVSKRVRQTADVWARSASYVCLCVRAYVSPCPF